MRNKNIKQMLNFEINSITINPTDKLIKEPIANSNEIKIIKKSNIQHIFLPIMAGVCCCILCLCICLSLILNNSTTSNAELTSYILKINPEFCITTNSKDEVVSICALNDDADTILDKTIFNNVEGEKFSVCINNILQEVKNEGFFVGYTNTIHLFAVNDNSEKLDNKLTNFGNIIRQGLNDINLPNIAFDMNPISITDFKSVMGLYTDTNNLDDMRDDIRGHRKFHNINHPQSQFNNKIYRNKLIPIYTNY